MSMTLDDLDAVGGGVPGAARSPAADRDQVSPAGARVPARCRAWPITALVDSQGATEAHGRTSTAEAIADITSTGETLRANHLKVLPDALILRSEATLWRSRRAEMDDAEDGGAVSVARNSGV
jgi:hypothetical protein